jgi:hypothetical protein
VFVLAPATWAAIKAFEGTPAPPPVRRLFTFTNQQRSAFFRDLPTAEVDKAHGVLRVQTKRGSYDIWAAPSRTGGTCFAVGLESSMTGKHGMWIPSTEACVQANDANPPLAASTDSASSETQIAMWGYAKGPETTVRVTMTDGRTMTLPVVEHFFLAALRKPGGIASITGLDATGKFIAHCVGTGGDTCPS